MSNTQHTRFKASVKEMLEAEAAKVLNLIPNTMSGKGWPDLFVAHRIWTGWIEIKINRDKCDSAQQKVIAALFRAGTEVIVLRYHEENTTVTFENMLGQVYLKDMGRRLSGLYLLDILQDMKKREVIWNSSTPRP